MGNVTGSPTLAVNQRVHTHGLGTVCMNTGLRETPHCTISCCFSGLTSMGCECGASTPRCSQTACFWDGSTARGRTCCGSSRWSGCGCCLCAAKARECWASCGDAMQGELTRRPSLEVGSIAWSVLDAPQAKVAHETIRCGPMYTRAGVRLLAGANDAASAMARPLIGGVIAIARPLIGGVIATINGAFGRLVSPDRCDCGGSPSLPCWETPANTSFFMTPSAKPTRATEAVGPVALET